MARLFTIYRSLILSMAGLAIIGCNSEANKWKPAITEGLLQCSFDAYGEESVKALEPLSLKLSATDNSFGILNDPFERETKSFVYELNDLALILSYEYHEMTELYPHRCQYKINRVDGIGAHNCMLAETDHFQLHYPYKIECKHITETKF